MRFNWFQKILISALITWVLFQTIVPLFQWGFLEVKVEPLVYLGGIAIVCFGILFTKFCNVFILLTSLISLTQTFYDFGLDSYIVSAFVAFVIGIVIYANQWQKWTKFVLRRTFVAAGFAFQLCVYFSMYTPYDAHSLFVAWLPVVYFIFHMRIPVLLFVILPNFLIGDFLLDHIPPVWLTPVYFVIMLVVSSLLNKFLKKHPSDWTLERYYGSWNPQPHHSGESNSSSDSERELPPGYYFGTDDQKRQWRDGEITDSQFRNEID